MPSGQYPPLYAGQDGTAGLLMSGPYRAWKTGDTSRANNVTLTADPDLVIPLAVVGAVYAFEAYLRYEGGILGSSDFAFKWTVPAGCSFWAMPANQSTSGTAGVGGEQAASSGTTNTVTAGSSGAGTVRSVTLRGTVMMSSTTGSLTLLWAQGTSSATATILHVGSRIEIARMS